MERVQEELGTIEVYENDIDFYLHQFQEKHNIEDMSKASQQKWIACLMDIQKKVFSDRSILKQKENICNSGIMATNCNSYNYDLLDSICDYYIYLSFLYEKECNPYGFTKLTNISYQLIEDWGNNYGNSNRLSSKSFDIYKKLTDAREQCNVARLWQMNHPTAPAIILNKFHGYNLPGVSKEQANKSALPAAELPKLSDDLRQSDTDFNGNIAN